MFQSFDDLVNTARVWVFQSKTALTQNQLSKIEQELLYFTNNWQAHGNDLLASYKLIYNRFIVVALDEASYEATGCSIDKLTHLIQEIEKTQNLSLLDRMQITYKQGDDILNLPMSKFKAAIGTNLDANTIVFNNLIETKGELLSKWETAMENSWHKQFLN